MAMVGIGTSDGNKFNNVVDTDKVSRPTNVIGPSIGGAAVSAVLSRLRVRIQMDPFSLMWMGF